MGGKSRNYIKETPMKLSMSILDAWFHSQGYSPESHIINDKLCLTGARFFQNAPHPNYVCLMTASQLSEQISPAKDPDSPVLVNGKDYILLPGQPLNRIIDLTMEAFEFYSSWETSLLQKIITETTLQDLLDLAHVVIGRPMNICNTRAWIYAVTKGYGSYVHPHWKNYVSKDTSYELNNDISLEMKNRPLNKDNRPTVAYSTASGGMVLYADIVVEGERIGEIMAYENNRPFTEKDIQIMHIFQDVVAAYARNNPSVLRSRSVVSEYLQDMLLQKPLDHYNVGYLLNLYGWEADNPFVVLCVQAKKSGQSDVIGRLCDDLEDSIANVQAFPYDNLAVALISLKYWKDIDEVIQMLLKIIPKRSFSWGLSHGFRGLDSFLDYHRQAVYALEHAVRFRLPYSTMRNIAIGCLRENLMQNPWLKSLLHPDFLTLTHYDIENNTQYTSSLYWYLFYSGNYTDAANQLDLHRNTLIYRINRIREIVHINPEDINEKELFLLSYLLYPYDSANLTANPE